MFLVGLVLLFISPLQAVDYYGEGKRFAENLAEEKSYLKKKVEEHKTGKEGSAEASQITKKCTAISGLTGESETSLYVFISFNVPEETWMSLSGELEKTGGIFVLRGLPENSFSQLAMKVQAMRRKGVKASVQLDPLLFTKYGIEQVPCFVITEEDRFDKIYGNVSLAYALEKMATQGDTAIAKTMREKL